MFLLFAAAEGGNAIFELFENNLINWVVLVIAICWGASRIMPSVFSNRKSQIDGAIQDARIAREEGEKFLTEQQAKIANAERESDNILVEAKQIAEKMRGDMEAATKKELADLEHRIDQEITNQRQLAVLQLRTAAAKAAIALSESAIPQALNDQAKAKLMNQFMDQLEASKN